MGSEGALWELTALGADAARALLSRALTNLARRMDEADAR